MSAPALPREAAYHQVMPDSVAARSYRLNVQPYNNQTFKSNDIIKIKLPNTRNCLFNAGKSYLKFQVNIPVTGSTTNPSGANSFVSFDGHCTSVIKTLLAYSGGGGFLLENSTDYGALHTAFMDLQVGVEARTVSTFAILGGQGGETTWANPSGRTCYGMAQNTSEVFCTGLVSHLFGNLSQRMFPIGETSDGLELHLQLNDFKSSFKAVTDATGTTPITTGQMTTWGDTAGAVLAANITITNVEYVAEYVELQANAMSAIRSMNGGRYVISGEQYRSISATVPASSTGTYSLLVNHRLSSLKSLWAGMYGTNNVGNMCLNSVTGRTKNNLNTYQWRIGSNPVPQRPVVAGTAAGVSGAEALMEVEKTIRGVNAVLGACSISKAGYNSQTNSTQIGSFIMGTELDAFDFTIDKPARSGVDTTSAPVFLDLTFHTGTYEAVNTIVWAHYDASIVVDASTGSVVKVE